MLQSSAYLENASFTSPDGKDEDAMIFWGEDGLQPSVAITVMEGLICGLAMFLRPISFYFDG
jgi:hypothetical protein